MNIFFFNKCLSAKRQLIEQAFGILKGRFRKLKHMDISKTDDTPEIVVAACTLHNICSESKEDLNIFLEMNWGDVSGHKALHQMYESKSGSEVRDRIVNLLKDSCTVLQ